MKDDEYEKFKLEFLREYRKAILLDSYKHIPVFNSGWIHSEWRPVQPRGLINQQGNVYYARFKGAS